MKNVTIQISDELYNRFKDLPSDINGIMTLSILLHSALLKALLPKEDAE